MVKHAVSLVCFLLYTEEQNIKERKKKENVNDNNNNINRSKEKEMKFIPSYRREQTTLR